mmetsp:Transcript_15168/g.18211  ORF Transcript_15168/g.18211 Transcript_15168/m.18211 type:complete len:228 (-) Transcript_15168:67-750(-)
MASSSTSSKPSVFRVFSHLKLILRRRSCSPLELFENGEALGNPLSEGRFHLLALHFVQTRHLLVDVVDAFGLPLFSVLDLLLAATSTGSRGAKGRAAVLFNIGLHVLIISKLITHSLLSLLVISPASIARPRVKVLNRWPTSPARVVVASDWLLGEVDVSKRHIRVIRKGLHDTIPCRGLLASSASSLRGNPADEERLARINLCFDGFLKICLRQLDGRVKMPFRVD